MCPFAQSHWHSFGGSSDNILWYRVIAGSQLSQTTLSELKAASHFVHETLLPTPTLNWPLLDQAMATKVWVKNENHLPTGAFKVRGGLFYMDRLVKAGAPPGVCAATRGNHGQSIAFAAARYGLPCVIFVPEGNNLDKNRAMRALGAEVIEVGLDFDESVAQARTYAEEQGLHLIPSFHPHLVLGVASYALEWFEQAPDLTKVYVPIGLGSGICGVLMAKAALNLDVEIIGVVSEAFPTYLESSRQGQSVLTPPAYTIADGLAVRQAHNDALGLIEQGVSKILTVSDQEISSAISILFRCTHNVAEGAGAAALAAAVKDASHHLSTDQLGVVLSGGNVAAEVLSNALQ